MTSLFPDGIHPIGASVFSVELRTSYQPQVSRDVVYRTDAVFAIQGDLGAQSSLCGGLMKKSNDGVLSLIQTLLTDFYMLWAFLDVSGFPSDLPASGSEQELRKAREVMR
jgi:hypothetical protein